MEQTQFVISVVTGNSNAAIDGIIGGFGKATDSANKFTSVVEKIGAASFHINNIRTAISGVVNDLNNAVDPGIKFNSSMADLQAITGVAGDKLDKIGNSARNTAKEFGISAAGAVESYKIYLSKLGSELANSSKELAMMGTNAAVLSKQLGGDVASATGILTTAMNQFGVSIDNPTEALKAQTSMMNIMSAAAKEGSAELKDISSALEQSGMMAKIANVSFAETNAAIQILDKAGKKGAEGGVGFRNVLAEITQGEMMPKQQLSVLQQAGIEVNALADKSRSFADRLKLLTPIVNDNAAMVKVFGKENVAAGIALVKGAGDIEAMAKKYIGTNSAFEMANTVMGSYQEKVNRTKAAIEDFGISLFNSAKPFLPFITIGMGALQVMANLSMASTLFSSIASSKFVVAIGAQVISLGSWIATTTMATLAQMGFNAALSMNPIGAVVLAIGAAIAAVALLINYWENIWSTIVAFGKWMWEHSPFNWLINIVDTIFPGFKKTMGELWDWIAGKFEALVGWIKKAFGWIKSLFSSGNDETKDATKAAVEDFAKQIKDVKIDGITVQAASDNAKSPFSPKGEKDKSTSRAGTQMASNIAQGGSKPTTINLSVKELIGIKELKTTNIQGIAKQTADEIGEAVLMLLQSVDGKLANS